MENEQLDQREILIRERDVLFPKGDMLQKAGNLNENSAFTKPEIPDHVTDIELRELIELWTGGRETVVFDKDGVPSVMVRVKSRTIGEVLGTEYRKLHPAFGDESFQVSEIWVSKYQNSMLDGHPVSLPFCRPERIRRPAAAEAACRDKGEGWALMPFSLWTFLALQSAGAGKLPSGNNDHGHDFFHPEEKGIPSGDPDTVLTGSGPVSWSHDGKTTGIWDMNGNLNEWVSGFRLSDGEVRTQSLKQVLSGDDSWQVWETGSGRLHYELTESTITLTDKTEQNGYSGTIGGCSFGDIGLDADQTDRQLLQAFGMIPPDQLPTGHGWRWVSTLGEMVPLCGGAYGALHHSGIFFAGMTKPADQDYSLSGMRSIWISPEGGAMTCQEN